MLTDLLIIYKQKLIELISTLREERKILKNREHAQINVIASTKRILLNEISQLEHKIRLITPQNDIDNDLCAELKSLSTQCLEINQTNGGLINLRLMSIHHTLELLPKSAFNSSTYDNRGKLINR